MAHKGNQKPSIPIAYSVHLKESYENMEEVRTAVKYSEHQWNICCDLKVIGMVMGLQQGFTKYCCFQCLWDSRDTANHYRKKNWPMRTTFQHLSFTPLVNRDKILLPPLHIKLGLMKTFVKTMGKTDSAGFKYPVEKFPKLVKQS